MADYTLLPPTQGGQSQYTLLPPSATPSQEQTSQPSPQETPVRDNTSVNYTDPQTGQVVQVPSWSLDTASQNPVQPRSFGERISDVYGEAVNSGFGGWLAKEAFYRTNHMRPSGMTDDQWWSTLTEAQKRNSQNYENLEKTDPSTGVAGVAANLLGDATGGVNPLYLFGGVAGKGMSPLAAAASRIATIGAANAAGNAVGQGYDISTGSQKDYDPWATVAAGGGAATMHGLLGEALPAATPYIKKFASDLYGDEASNLTNGFRGTYPTHSGPLTPEELAKMQAENPDGLVGEVTDDSNIPDELSGKRPEVKPPVNPTVDTTHVDPISETDETGTYHPINVRDPDTGEVTSAGRAYVDPDTGAPQGSVLAHPLTKENHTVTPETQGVIESKLPGGSEAISPAMRAQPVVPEDIRQPGFVSTPNPDPSRPSHTFTYETPDGKIVKGSYDVEGNTIHSIDIGDKTNPVKLGAGETLNLGKQLAAAHPDVDTIEGLRISGANPDRTVKLNAQALRDRGQPSVPEEPTVGVNDEAATEAAATKPVSNPNTVDDKMAGNINKNVLGLNPEANYILDEQAKMIPPNDPQGHGETIEQARQMLADHEGDHESFLYNTVHDEKTLPAFQVASTALHGANVMQIALANKAGDTEKAAELLAKLTRDTPRYQEIAGVPGRTLNARGIKPTTDVYEKAGVSKEDAMKILAKVGDNPEAIDQIAKDLSKSKDGSFIKQAYYAALLSNPDTHARYYTGMFANFVRDMGSMGLGSMFGQLRRFDGTNTSRIYGREMATRLYGSVMGIANAVQALGKDIYKAGEEFKPSDLNPKNIVNSAVNVPGTILHGAEETMRNIAQTSDFYGMSARHAIDNKMNIGDVVKNPPASVLEHSADYGKVMSLNDAPSPLAQAAINGMQHLSKNSPAASAAAIALVPFMRRGDAVTRAWIRNSLLGVVPGADRYNTAMMKSALAGSSADMDHLAGRIAIAGGLAATYALMAQDDHITGDGPDSYALKQQMLAGGWRPQSYKDAEGNYHSYAGLEPFANDMSTIANLVNRLKEDGDHKSYMDKANTALYTVAHTLEDNEWLSKISPVVSTWNAQEGEHSQRNFLSQLPSSFVPSGLSTYNQQNIDPIKRDTTSPDMLTQMKNDVKAKLPGFSQELPAKLDVYGRPIPTNMAAFPVSKADTDPAVQEINRLSNGKLLVGPVGKDYTDEDTGIKTKFTPEQLHQYQEKAGQYILNDFRNSISDPSYGKMSDDDKRDLLKEIVTDQHKNAKEEVVDGTSNKYTLLPSQGAEYTLLPPQKVKQ